MGQEVLTMSVELKVSLADREYERLVELSQEMELPPERVMVFALRMLDRQRNGSTPLLKKYSSGQGVEVLTIGSKYATCQYVDESGKAMPTYPFVATLAECDEFLWDCPSVQCLFGKQCQEDKKDGV